ncbi:TrmH family RNA methyltransferase [Orbaceae bacterium ESL0721]|nr:TrmH family RNA methyltransferase [Orbaceae bacterium ESL0721]
MNDSRDKAKPTIFYATKQPANRRSSPRGEGEFAATGRRPQERNKSRNGGIDSNRSGQKKGKLGQNSRIETFNAYTKSPESTQKRERADSAPSNISPSKNSPSVNSLVKNSLSKSSPWQKKISELEQAPTFSHDEYHKRRKEEAMVYSQNSCKAVFKHRKDAIVKAFITEEMSYQFKDLIKWLVHQHLGYDIVTDAELTKITETPHHGGIALIIKKRQPTLLLDYLQQHHKQDYLLAIDDINNPHNLGGLMRTAAFYGISGVILRQPALLDSGAAMRVAEGGIEAVTPIKCDDFIDALDRLKEANYKVIVLLPTQMSRAKALNEIIAQQNHPKTVIVLSEKINRDLIDIADEAIYLKGNSNMAALNISVAAGILLSQLSTVKNL